MTLRLSEIDESNRSDHFWLTDGDNCLYLYEYTSGRNYAFSATNSLINNLKKKPGVASLAEMAYKAGAIRACARGLQATLNPKWLDIATLVPVPGSKQIGDPHYDDRMTEVCQGIRPGLDVRALVAQTASTVAAHEAGPGERITVPELTALYAIDEALAAKPLQTIGIIDDVLTAGTHFKAMQSVLGARFPGVPIVGIFIARRVFAPPA